MKQIRKVLFFALAPLVLFGEEDYSSMSYWDFHPLHIGGNMIRIGGAPVEAHDYGGHLYFRKNSAFVNLLVPVSRTTYFFPRFDFVNFTLDWNQNPKFNETHFYYAQFGLMFYSTGLENWRWIIRADYNIDLEHFSQGGKYGLFSGLVWGKYELNPRWSYHVGAFTTIGLEAAPVYPVIGFDYAPNKYWMLEAVFPILYSIQYKIDKNWKLAIKGRPLKERFRVSSKEPQPRSIFNYSSIGTEFSVKYEQFLWLEIELYGGYNFGGNFYIKDQSGHKPLYTEVSGAPYGGLSIDYGF